MDKLDWPLMRNNITRDDLTELRFFLGQAGGDVPRLTNGDQVRAFEEEFAAWLGVKYAVMVNSGASANLITMQALKIMHGPGRVLVPCITWVSDIAAVLHAGLEPHFMDVDPESMGMAAKYAPASLAVFPTHCLGFRCSPPPSGILIEDCCESIGATLPSGRKLGSVGLMSNFSFYYAHHMTTIEGGMVCTDSEDAYQLLRMLRGHGLVREMTNPDKRAACADNFPDLDPEFIFACPAYNVRPTEINAVLGRSQLKRLNANVEARTRNLMTFLAHLGPKYRSTYRTLGSSNYALPLVLVEPDAELFCRVTALLRELGVEYRKGTAGGGNQLRQPYARERWGDLYKQFPQAEHIHQYGLYVGNYPDLPHAYITTLCERLNAL